MSELEKKLRDIAKSWPQDTPEARQTVEELIQMILGLTDEECLRLAEHIRQFNRAAALGLKVDFDDSTGFYFIADAATNCVIAPPPMNLETVTAWLDDYEQEAAAE